MRRYVLRRLIGIVPVILGVIFVTMLALGVRAFRRSTRMAALLEMTAEGEAALVRLRASIGQKGIDRKGRAGHLRGLYTAVPRKARRKADSPAILASRGFVSPHSRPTRRPSRRGPAE